MDRATSMKISGTYTVKKWDETPYDVIEGRMKATRATVEYAFSGDIEGTAKVEYLMFYKSFDDKDPHKADAEYVGIMRIIGKLKGKSGSFSVKDSGAYGSGVAISALWIVPGSGTGELSGIGGNGGYKADQSGWAWELDVFL
jgi:hypothetical protein